MYFLKNLSYFYSQIIFVSPNSNSVSPEKLFLSIVSLQWIAA